MEAQGCFPCNSWIPGICFILKFPSWELFPGKRRNSLCGKTKGHSRDEQTIPWDFPWEFTPGMGGFLWNLGGNPGKRKGKTAISCGGKIPKIPLKIPDKNQSQKFKIPRKIKKEKSQKFLVKINPIKSKFLLKWSREKNLKFLQKKPPISQIQNFS